MATEVQINFVVDAIVNAGFDAATWLAFLQRSKLETELTELESEARNLQAAADADAAASAALLIANADAQAAKRAEIDAL